MMCFVPTPLLANFRDEKRRDLLPIRSQEVSYCEYLALNAREDAISRECLNENYWYICARGGRGVYVLHKGDSKSMARVFGT